MESLRLLGDTNPTTIEMDAPELDPLESVSLGAEEASNKFGDHSGRLVERRVTRIENSSSMFFAGIMKDFQVELEKTSRRLQVELEKTCQCLIKEFKECFEAKVQDVERHIEQKLESMPNIHEVEESFESKVQDMETHVEKTLERLPKIHMLGKEEIPTFGKIVGKEVLDLLYPKFKELTEMNRKIYEENR